VCVCGVAALLLCRMTALPRNAIILSKERERECVCMYVCVCAYVCVCVFVCVCSELPRNAIVSSKECVCVCMYVYMLVWNCQ
jgi:hypothetical protein